MKHRIFLLTLLLAAFGFSQDTTLIRSCYGGGSLTVPEGFSWVIEKAYINSGDGYNILVSNSNFKPKYRSGEKLQTPYYMAEMELLDRKEGVFYFFYLRQSKD